MAGGPPRAGAPPIGAPPLRPSEGVGSGGAGHTTAPPSITPPMYNPNALKKGEAASAAPQTAGGTGGPPPPSTGAPPAGGAPVDPNPAPAAAPVPSVPLTGIVTGSGTGKRTYALDASQQSYVSQPQQQISGGGPGGQRPQGGQGFDHGQRQGGGGQGGGGKSGQRIDPSQVPRPERSGDGEVREWRTKSLGQNPPPPAGSLIRVVDDGNCSPRFMRSSITQVGRADIPAIGPLLPSAPCCHRPFSALGPLPPSPGFWAPDLGGPCGDSSPLESPTCTLELPNPKPQILGISNLKPSKPENPKPLNLRPRP